MADLAVGAIKSIAERGMFYLDKNIAICHSLVTNIIVPIIRYFVIRKTLRERQKNRERALWQKNVIV